MSVNLIIFLQHYISEIRQSLTHIYLKTESDTEFKIAVYVCMLLLLNLVIPMLIHPVQHFKLFKNFCYFIVTNVCTNDHSARIYNIYKLLSQRVTLNIKNQVNCNDCKDSINCKDSTNVYIPAVNVSCGIGNDIENDIENRTIRVKKGKSCYRRKSLIELCKQKTQENITPTYSVNEKNINWQRRTTRKESISDQYGILENRQCSLQNINAASAIILDPSTIEKQYHGFESEADSISDYESTNEYSSSKYNFNEIKESYPPSYLLELKTPEQIEVDRILGKLFDTMHVNEFVLFYISMHQYNNTHTL